MTNTDTITPAGNCIARYMDGHPRYGQTEGAIAAYRNEFWEAGRNGRTFASWLADTDHQYDESRPELLTWIPAMAKAIYAEAYELNALEHTTPTDEEVAAIVRESFPEAVSGRNVARLRDMVRELKTLKEQAEAPIDGHDPRIRHLFVAAAQEADRRDYCPVYDAIASVAGIPTRNELAPYLSTIWSVPVTVRVTYTYEATAEEYTTVYYEVDAPDADSARRQAREDYNSESTSAVWERVDEDSLNHEVSDRQSETLLEVGDPERNEE